MQVHVLKRISCMPFSLILCTPLGIFCYLSLYSGYINPQRACARVTVVVLCVCVCVCVCVYLCVCVSAFSILPCSSHCILNCMLVMMISITNAKFQYYSVYILYI